MNQHSVADLAVAELLYAIGGRQVGTLVQDTLHNSYNLIWRFAWVRFELQRSPFRYVFL